MTAGVPRPQTSPQIAGRTATLTGWFWYLQAIQGLRPDQVADLDVAILQLCPDHARVGGNHVLQALLDTGFYQRTWPGYEGD
jgi:hypothetical protein